MTGLSMLVQQNDTFDHMKCHSTVTFNDGPDESHPHQDPNQDASHLTISWE